ncbi:MAG: hypothetical protein MI725_17715 [Pirellulales bacterium]|nr:hypothetical protein [Pirellulales bacterium]
MMLFMRCFVVSLLVVCLTVSPLSAGCYSYCYCPCDCIPVYVSVCPVPCCEVAYPAPAACGDVWTTSKETMGPEPASAAAEAMPEHPVKPTLAEDPPPIAETELPAEAAEAPIPDPSPAPVEQPADELFEPTEEPAEEPAADVEVEETPVEEEMPPFEVETEEEDTPQEEESSEFDDLFGQQEFFRILQQNGGLASKATKLWIDDTGKYQCEARMLQVTPEAVVLVKPGGAQKAVPLTRLSDDDLRFVQQQVSAKRELLARRAVTEKFAANWSN